MSEHALLKNPDCYDFDIEYSSGTLDIKVLSDIITHKACQKMCQDEGECMHFTHW